MVIDSMRYFTIKRTTRVLALVAMVGPAFAQIDLSGSWVALNQEDVMGRMTGPYCCRLHRPASE